MFLAWIGIFGTLGHACHALMGVFVLRLGSWMDVYFGFDFLLGKPIVIIPVVGRLGEMRRGVITLLYMFIFIFIMHRCLSNINTTQINTLLYSTENYSIGSFPSENTDTGILTADLKIR